MCYSYFRRQEPLAKHGGQLQAKDYVLLQLKLEFNDGDTFSEIDPGARLDPEGHNAYSGSTQPFIYAVFFIFDLNDVITAGVKALKMCSVPLDVPHSLSTLREALNKSHFTSRALQHSRQMLVLYLAGQNQSKFAGLP